jgi:hypothetical protein
MVGMDILKELLTRIREEAGTGTGPRELARLVLERILTRPDAVQVLLPAVTAFVKDAERDRVREREHRAFGDGSGPYANPAEEAMRALLAERAYVPGHGMVPWGQLTGAYHQLRVQYLTEMIARYTASNRATIRRHQAAARLLESSGCTTLDDYAFQFGALPAELDPQEEESMST